MDKHSLEVFKSVEAMIPFIQELGGNEYIAAKEDGDGRLIKFTVTIVE